MIPRYSREEIIKIWEPKNRYNLWLDIELHAAKAMELYKISKGTSSKIRKSENQC